MKKITSIFLSALIIVLFFGCEDDGNSSSDVDGMGFWEPSKGLEVSVQSLAIDFDDKIFAGTLEGDVYLSSDSAETWTLIGELSNNVKSIQCKDGGFVFAGTHCADLFKSVEPAIL